MPGWVQLGYDEYAKRLPHECELVLKEIAPGKRSKNSDVARIVKDEGDDQPVGPGFEADRRSGCRAVR